MAKNIGTTDSTLGQTEGGPKQVPDSEQKSDSLLQLLKDGVAQATDQKDFSIGNKLAQQANARQSVDEKKTQSLPSTTSKDQDNAKPVSTKSSESDANTQQETGSDLNPKVEKDAPAPVSAQAVDDSIAEQNFIRPNQLVDEVISAQRTAPPVKNKRSVKDKSETNKDKNKKEKKSRKGINTQRVGRRRRSRAETPYTSEELSFQNKLNQARNAAQRPSRLPQNINDYIESLEDLNVFKGIKPAYDNKQSMNFNDAIVDAVKDSQQYEVEDTDLDKDVNKEAKPIEVSYDDMTKIWVDEIDDEAYVPDQFIYEEDGELIADLQDGWHFIEDANGNLVYVKMTTTEEAIEEESETSPVDHEEFWRQSEERIDKQLEHAREAREKEAKRNEYNAGLETILNAINQKLGITPGKEVSWPLKMRNFEGGFDGYTWKDLYDLNESKAQARKEEIDRVENVYSNVANKPIQKRGKNRVKSDEELIAKNAETIWKNIKDMLFDLYPNKRQSLSERYRNMTDEDRRELTSERGQLILELMEREERIQERFLNPYEVIIEGDELVEIEGSNGFYERKFHPDVQTFIDLVAEEYGVTEYEVLQLMQLRASIGIDKDGNIVDKPAREFKLSKKEAIAICNEILISQEQNGHPLGIIKGKNNLTIGNTRCYPLGYIPSDLAARLCKNKNSVLYGTNSRELAQAVRESWLNKTQPTIVANTKGDAISQRYAIYTMLRAMLALDGKTPSDWNVTNAPERSYLDMLEETKNVPENSDMKETFEYRDDIAEKYLNRLKKTYLREHKTIDKDGVEIITDGSRKTEVGKAFSAVATWMRFAGVVGNPAIIIPGYIEHIGGNLFQKMGNALLGAEIDDKRFAPTKFMIDQAIHGDGKEAVIVMNVLYNAAGMDALKAYAALDLPVDKESARKFLDEYVNGEKDEKKRAKLIYQMNKWVQYLMPGNLGMHGMDAKRFIEVLLINNAYAKKNGKPYVDAAGFEEAIRNGSIGRAMLDSVVTTQGSDAFVAMSNLNLGRKSALTYAVNRVVRASGVTEFLLTDMLDTYIEYGVNAFQNIFPFSNTFCYLASKGIASSPLSNEAKFLDYQLGGHDEFWDGLRKNFVYDCMKFGNFGLIALLSFFTIEALGGIDDPDDPNDIYNWLMYLVGKDDPNTTEDERSRMPIPAWWSYDFAGWGFGAGVCLAIWGRDKDPIKAWNVYLSSIYDSLDGTSVVDMINWVTHGKTWLDDIQQSMDNEDYLAPSDWKCEAVIQAEHQLANFVRKMTPGIINNYTTDTLLRGSDLRDRSTTKKYDTENYSPEKAREEGHTVSIDDPVEAQRRSDSKRNIVWALINNIRFNGSPFTPSDSENTGYLSWEMPIATIKDPQRTSYKSNETYMIDKDKAENIVDKAERDNYYDDHAANLIRTLKEEWGDDPLKFIHNGGMIEFEARKNLKRYCYKQILLLEINKDQRKASGMAYSDISQQISIYYDIIDNWVNNEDIPWSDDGYEKLVSDYYDTYQYPDGSPAPAYMYIIDPSIKKITKPIGNHPTSLLPFTEVETKNRGYNAETINNWFKKGFTDLDKIRELNATAGENGEPAKVGFGRYAEDYTNNVIFGAAEGDLNKANAELNITGNEAPTINLRSYVPREGKLPEDLNAITKESVAAEMGINTDQLSGKSNTTSGYNSNYKVWKSYGGGGGGSSYGSTRIYSNPRSINNDKAATMYTKQPYSTRTDSLRPQFATKGSREAYRRQDM